MKYDMSGRGIASVACATASAVALCFAVSASVMAAEPTTNAPAMMPAPAAAPPKGEFDNSCAMGLASGQVVKTDCSVNWAAPDGKVYCFSTEGSKQAFLKDPGENIQKAREFFLAKDQSAQASPPAGEIAAPAAKGPAKEFTEDDVNAAVKKTVSAAKMESLYSMIPSLTRISTSPSSR
jgi:YHS domain-containing protein